MENFSVWHWLIVLLLVGLMFVPQVMYILSVQSAFEAIDSDLRPMAPGLSWLILVPVFNLVWIFFIVVYLERGYKAMAERGRLSRATTAGYGVGIGAGVCWALCVIPLLNLVVWIPALVLWILHWVQVVEARKLVVSQSTPRGIGSALPA